MFPDWAMAVGCLIAIASLFYFTGFAARLAGVLASIYCATQISYRFGVLYGYGRGFQAGHERAVDG